MADIALKERERAKAEVPTENRRDESHPLRKDGDLILTGRAAFLDDVKLHDMHHAAVLRSNRPRAKIVSINISKAEAFPGVRCVLTGALALKHAGVMPAFFDPAIVGCPTAEFRCLAHEEVRWVGQPVAAVAADTLANAEAARDLIHVQYEDLPFVLEAAEAAKEDAPKVFEHWASNILAAFPFREGDAEAKITSAKHTLSGSLTSARHQCAPMETRGYIASWDSDGQLNFWGSTQNPHPVRSNLAKILSVPEHKVRVKATRLGGGFGHKFNGYAEEPLVCVLSKLAGVPVKWRETREECFLVGARDFSHEFSFGFDDDGVVSAVKVRSLGNVGALETWGGWAMTFPAGMTFPGPYFIKDYDVVSHAIVTNKAPLNGYRGYGKEQAAMVLETMMDMVAEHLALDPTEVRRRNFIPQEAFPHWTAAKHLNSGDYHGALCKVLELSDYSGLRALQKEALKDGRRLGVGVAFELTPEGGDFSGSFVRGFDTSTVRIYPSGSVVVLTGVTSSGTGNETTISHLVANELGISADKVAVVQGDTDICPFGFGNFSSRSISTGAAAAVLAAREMRERLVSSAAALLDVVAADIEVGDGHFCSRSDSAKRMSFEDVAIGIYRHAMARAGLDHLLFEVTKVAKPENFHHAPDEKGRFSTYPSYPYSAHVALVEVDFDTGVVKVKDYSVVDDCGTVISQKFVDGQLFGAIAQGIGGLLWEQQPYDARTGAPVAKTFKNYLTPRAPDLPTIRITHQHTPSPFTLLGTKGAGESGVGGAMACVLNAVNDALRPIGARVSDVPLNPQTVLRAIDAAEARS